MQTTDERWIQVSEQRAPGHGTAILQASIADLHRLRIDIKRLRYVLEFFRDVLGTGVRPVIRALTRAQDHLGGLQDAEVARERIRAFLRTRKKDRKAGRRLPAVDSYLSDLKDAIDEARSGAGAVFTDLVAPEFRSKLASAIAAL